MSDHKESFKEWSKAAPELYDRLTSIKLEWPTLCGQWSPTATNHALVSTFTLRQDAEYLRLVEINSKLKHPDYIKQEWKIPNSDDLTSDSKFESFALLFLAQKNGLIAGLSDNGKLHFFKEDGSIKSLDAHADSGSGLAFDPTSANVVSGSVDGNICIWNTDNFEKIAEFDANSAINEITWTHPNHIIVALESGEVLHLNSKLEVSGRYKLSDSAINTASLSPFSENLLAAGDDNGVLVLFDIRSLTHAQPKPLYSIKKHDNKITHLRWSPHIDGVLATGGMDGMITLFDFQKIGLTSAQDDGEPLEVMFKHLGHIGGRQVTALDFHPTIPLQLLSSDEKCKLMVWQIKKKLWSNEGFKKLSFS